MDTGPVSAIDVLLAAARAGLDRVRPEDLAGELAAGALIVDIRPVEQRSRDGHLDGAVVIDRNVLEWRLDPTCPHHLPQVTDATSGSSWCATRATAPVSPRPRCTGSGYTVPPT